MYKKSVYTGKLIDTSAWNSHTTTDINWGHQGARRAQGRAEGRKGGQEGCRGGQEGRSILLFLPSWNTGIHVTGRYVLRFKKKIGAQYEAFSLKEGRPGNNTRIRSVSDWRQPSAICRYKLKMANSAWNLRPEWPVKIPNSGLNGRWFSLHIGQSNVLIVIHRTHKFSFETISIKSLTGVQSSE